MYQNYWQQKEINPLLNSMGQPVKELMELNAKTLQGFTYLLPLELLMSKKPQDLLDRNMELFLENSHNALNYMQSMFGIMEKHLMHNIEQVSRASQGSMMQMMKSTAKNPVSEPAKKATKHVKASAAKTKTHTSSHKVSAAKSSTSKSSATKTSDRSKQQAKPAPAAAKDSMKHMSNPTMSSNETRKPSPTPSPMSASNMNHMKPMMRELDPNNKNKI